jgi:type VI secretion system protein VasJ
MKPLTDSLRARALTWLEPISPQAPCGTHAKGHASYEAVFNEVARLESPSGEAVRWSEVVHDAGELLRQDTKDLWLAAYFAYALYATEGLPGALTGTWLLSGLLERYWEGLFPEASRLRSRGLALAWYVERMARVLPTLPAASASPELVEALKAAVSRLGEVMRERLASQSPATSPLLESLERLRASAPEPAQAAPPAPPAAKASPLEPPAPASQLPPTPTAELTDAGGATDFLRHIGSSLVSAASVLRRADSAAPLSYRILRTGLWLHFSQPPPTGPQGRSSLPPLPSPLRAKLERLLANARWAELLDEAESAVTQHRLALDLQRFSAQALASLGPSHAAAREAVLGELAALLRRMPEVVELLAADGTPLADEATRQWLRQEVRGAPAQAILITPAAPGASPPPAEAQGGEALAQRSEPSSGRARFLSRLALARACAQAGQLHVARALYEALEAELSAHALDSWEPPLAAVCLEGLLSCLTSDKEFLTDSLEKEFWIHYRRLALLDAAAALRLRLPPPSSAYGQAPPGDEPLYPPHTRGGSHR